ncbi:fumarylacetoacetase [soil metagenome]
MIDETHDAALTSWIDAADANETEFPIQNLPFGTFRRSGTGQSFRAGVAIGDRIVDLSMLAERRTLPSALIDLFDGGRAATLKALMAAGTAPRRELRAWLSSTLRSGSDLRAAIEPTLVAQSQADTGLPAAIGDYTDFYAGIHHATAVGKLFRPDQPLLPNYKWVPIGYHGRASSIVASGTAFKRPRGQFKLPDQDAPVFGPCRRLDYELELAAWVSSGNALGEPIDIADADDHLFGISLLNDWSARDLQAWEYQPLGPFLAKSFATTTSPWVVTLEALEPFRTAFTRAPGEIAPLPHLDSGSRAARDAFDIALSVSIETAAMRAQGKPAQRLSSSNFRDAFWTFAQMLTHHASNGCNLSPGDMLGSGTQSGAGADQGGSLLELTQGGKQAITLASGEQRTFLLDGDTVVLNGRCERAGFRSIGFGPCSGTVLPA